MYLLVAMPRCDRFASEMSSAWVICPKPNMISIYSATVPLIVSVGV